MNLALKFGSSCPFRPCVDWVANRRTQVPNRLHEFRIDAAFEHATVTQFHSRLFNVTVTNVPGPREPMFAFGARLVDAIPLVPLAAEHAVGVAVLSLDGQVVFCLNCDRDAVPDVAVAARGIEMTLERLAGGGVSAPPRPGSERAPI